MKPEARNPNRLTTRREPGASGRACGIRFPRFGFASHFVFETRVYWSAASSSLFPSWKNLVSIIAINIITWKILNALRITSIGLLILPTCDSGMAQSGARTFQSTEKQTSLLELYTSEGCSSCPPAETWLSRLKNDPALWKDFVPVAFHVDYWDYLGWRDPWAAKSFSERQRAIAESWKAASVYTPGFVLNGKEWRAWSGHSTLATLRKEPVGMLKITSTDSEHWQVSFAPSNGKPQRYEVFAALLGSGLSSDVKAGENKGRRLNHDFVVLALEKKTLSLRENQLQGEFVLSSKGKTRNGRLALAAWVSRAGHLEPLQAIGGWLDKPTGR